MATEKTIIDQASFNGMTVFKKEGGSIEVSGAAYSSTMAALKDIANKSGFHYEDKWNTQQFGTKLIGYLKTIHNNNGAEEIVIHETKSNKDAIIENPLMQHTRSQSVDLYAVTWVKKNVSLWMMSKIKDILKTNLGGASYFYYASAPTFLTITDYDSALRFKKEIEAEAGNLVEVNQLGFEDIVPTILNLVHDNISMREKICEVLPRIAGNLVYSDCEDIERLDKLYKNAAPRSAGNAAAMALVNRHVRQTQNNNAAKEDSIIALRDSENLTERFYYLKHLYRSDKDDAYDQIRLLAERGLVIAIQWMGENGKSLLDKIQYLKYLELYSQDSAVAKTAKSSLEDFIQKSDTALCEYPELKREYDILVDNHDELKKKHSADVEAHNHLMGEYNKMKRTEEDRAAKQEEKDPIVKVLFTFKVKGFWGWSRERKVVEMRKSMYKTLANGSDRKLKSYIINNSRELGLGIMQSLNVEEIEQVSIQLDE